MPHPRITAGAVDKPFFGQPWQMTSAGIVIANVSNALIRKIIFLLIGLEKVFLIPLIKIWREIGVMFGVSVSGVGSTEEADMLVMKRHITGRKRAGGAEGGDIFDDFRMVRYCNGTGLG